MPAPVGSRNHRPLISQGQSGACGDVGAGCRRVASPALQAHLAWSRWTWCGKHSQCWVGCANVATQVLIALSQEQLAGNGKTGVHDLWASCKVACLRRCYWHGWWSVGAGVPTCMCAAMTPAMPHAINAGSAARSNGFAATYAAVGARFEGKASCTNRLLTSLIDVFRQSE